MKTLIIYASKTGTTEKCASILNKNLKDSTMINLSRIQNEDIDKYDIIIIGTPIRMGIIDKRVKKFISKNYNILKNKKTAYFICCGFNENWKQYYDQNFSKELLDNAIIYDTFGEDLNIDKQKGLDKFIVKMVSKSMDKNRKIEILNKNINNFIENIKEVNNPY